MSARRLAGGLAGAAALIAGVTVLSRLVGFLRQLALVGQVGAGEVGDAYASANIVPNVLFEVVAGGALASVAVPLLAGPLARGRRDDVDRIASALLGWTLAALVPLGVALALLARPVAEALLRADGGPQVELAASFLVLFSAQVPLYGVSVVLAGVLQAHRRFLWPALVPLLSSLVVIPVYLVHGRLVGADVDPTALDAGDVAWLGWGTTAGVVVLALPLLVPVHRAGVRLRPPLRFPPGVAARARALAGAGIGALLAQQASVLSVVAVANGEGSAGTYVVVTSMQAVYLLPYAVLAFPLATAAYPRLAERAATGDTAGFADLASATTRAVLAAAAVGAVALVAAAPAVEQAFAAIAAGDMTGMADGLAVMALGLLGFALVLHLSRALYSLDRGRAAVVATAAGWAVVGLAAWGLGALWTGAAPDQPRTLLAVGAATALGMTVAGAGLLVGLARGAGRAAVAGVPRTLVVLLAAGAAAAWVGRLAVDGVLGAAGTGLVGAVLAALAGGVVVLLVLLAALRVADPATLRGLRARVPAPR